MARGGEQADPAAPEALEPAPVRTRRGRDQSESNSGGRSGGQAGGCIILADSEASVPAELLAGLARRGMKVAVVTDTPAAMVRLARAGASAVLVAAGVELPGQADLLDAIRKYHPATGCWAFDRAGATIRLHKLGPASVRPPGTPGAPGIPPAPAAPKPSQAPRIPASNGHVNGTPKGGGKRRPLDDIVLHLPGSALGPDEPLVTEEELAMLLGSGVDDGRG